MDTLGLLREIAAVMANDPEYGYREFEWNIGYKGNWLTCTDGWSALLYRVDNMHTYGVRRRPRTIKVSGEVPEEIVEQARNLSSVSDIQEYPPGYDIAVALLDLIEQDEDK